jgi:hypothetical protein
MDEVRMPTSAGTTNMKSCIYWDYEGQNQHHFVLKVSYDQIGSN